MLFALLLAVVSPFTDYREQRPGRKHLITVADLPAPNASEDVANGPDIAARRPQDKPSAPEGYTVSLFAEGLEEPRQIRTAPNGDLFVAESAAGRIKVFRGATASTFASGLNQPFGIAFHGGYVYIGETDAVTRVPLAGGKPQRLVALPGGGHWTRDLIFSPDGRRLFISVGSYSNVSDGPQEKGRANILVCDPDGKNLRVFASGLRNPVGLAVEAKTGRLWTSVNERDRLGDNLPPDYVTHVDEGAFYGWPWYYIGAHQDPRHAGKHPELKDKVVIPDVLLEPHNASLGITFWNGDLYAAQHGSWNRSVRTGYEVIRVPMKNGAAVGGYEDFLTGFVRPDGKVWGRPVGVAVAADGALLVTEDASGTIWRVSRAR